MRENDEKGIEVRVENKTIWLTQLSIGVLYDVDRSVITKRISNVYEEKKGYDTGITFSNLNREPDNYKGQKVKFYGRVLQVLEGKNEVDIRLATKKFSIVNSYSSGSSSLDNLSYMEDIVYAYYDPKTSNYRILEGDMITTLCLLPIDMFVYLMYNILKNLLYGKGAK